MRHALIELTGQRLHELRQSSQPIGGALVSGDLPNWSRRARQSGVSICRWIRALHPSPIAAAEAFERSGFAVFVAADQSRAEAVARWTERPVVSTLADAEKHAWPSTTIELERPMCEYRQPTKQEFADGAVTSAQQRFVMFRCEQFNELVTLRPLAHKALESLGEWYPNFRGRDCKNCPILFSPGVVESTNEVPTVTLACIDCVNPGMGAKTLAVSARGLAFADVKLFSHEMPEMPAEIDFIQIPQLKTVDEYNMFVLRQLWKHIDTTHVLTVQEDGYVVNPQLWDAGWLKYDYIGSLWDQKFLHAKRSRVGNSGFCLRSKRLLTRVAQLATDDALGHSRYRWARVLDDVFICHDIHPQLTADGYRFAPPDVAARFGFERPTPENDDWHNAFGFHGKHTYSTRRLDEDLAKLEPGPILKVKNWLGALDLDTQNEPMEKRTNKYDSIAVVIVSYRIAENRLADFFEWNDATFRADDVLVYVVTDREYDVPDYAQCVIFPESKLPKENGKPIFSLSKTKNRGLRTAVEDGADIVVCSDIDIWFPPYVWQRIRETPAGHAFIPVYLMAKTWENRRNDSHQDFGATGTIIMRADHWRQIHYDPRYFGYGAEDGKILADIKQAGLQIDRHLPVYHIAHERGTDQHNFKGRTDYHNKDFNPLRFKENMVFANSPTPDDPDA